MPSWLIYSFSSVVVVLAAIALFFFVLTRGALILRSFGSSRHSAEHIYPIYSNMRLIKLIDFQPLIAAILLFQYDKLVSMITAEVKKMDLHGKDALITSCAFGNVIPRVVVASDEAHVRKVFIVDIIQNELVNARNKLAGYDKKIELLEENALAVGLPDNSIDANVIFFLLHELPHELKGESLKEAVRTLAPGGKLFLAEFHRPSLWVLRTLSWTYFKVFEPLGLALWDTHDPLRQLEAMGGLTCTRRTVFFGNFQVIVATKNS